MNGNGAKLPSGPFRPREELLAMLAEAGAELVSTVTAHRLPRELFDRFPGGEATYAGDRLFWSKSGTLAKALSWSVYTNEPPVEFAPEPADG